MTRAWLSVLGILALAATLPMLLLRSFSMAVVAVGTTHPYKPELADKAVWVSVGLAVIALFFALQSATMRDWLARPRVELVLLWVSLGAAVAAIASMQTIDLMPLYSYGFGASVCLATLALVPVVSRLLSSPVPSITRFLAAASVIVSLIWYLPLLIQPPWGVINLEHSSYVINEVVAPGAGKLPLGDFIPQYTSLLGWPIAPLVSLVQGSSLVYLVASTYLSGLAIITMCGVVYLAWRVLPVRIRSLAILLTVPLILVSFQMPQTPGGTITRLFSAIPVRTLPTVAVAITLIWFAGKPQVRRALVLGVACGLSALNNFEFGFPTLIAAVIVLSVFGPLARFPVRAGATIAGALAVFATYSVGLALMGAPMKLTYWVAIARGFASGFYAIEMPIIGTYVLVLMVLGGGTVLGLYWLSRHRNPGTGAGDPRAVSAAIVAAFIGLVGLGSFGYYVGRSVNSGQLQIFLLHMALVSVAVLGLIRVPNLLNQRDYRRVLAATIIAIPPSLAVASLLQAPDPQYEWARVLPHGSVPPLLAADADLDRIREKLAAATLALGGEAPAVAVNSGNYVELRLGVDNISVLNRADDTVINPFLLEEFCRNLGRVSGPILTQGVVGDSGQGICDGFTVVRTLGDNYAIITKTESP